MLSWRILKVALLCLAGASQSVGAAAPVPEPGYQAHPRAETFIQEMVKEHRFTKQEVLNILAKARRQEEVLELIQRPYEKTLPWHKYRAIFIKPKRINAGQAFMLKYAVALERAQYTYGVDPNVIAAIIGVETHYGTIMGTYRVLDALSTLAFDYPKRPLFWRELKAFLVMAREEHFEVDQLKGSYAGAMGYGQFIPSSFRAYAVDFDGDGKKDIWNNPVDAIGSVANYLARHGWEKNAPVMKPLTLTKDITFNTNLEPYVTLKDLSQYAHWQGQLPDDTLVTLLEYEQINDKETLMGFKNFYVITRYNHSRLYARAVFDLSRALAIDQRAQQLSSEHSP
jgi:membrane-bound lytic murein transglycosylase B